jgi:hypothetical protein
MAQTVIVQLTDDIDGGEADETVVFALNGNTYEIDLNSQNADRIRQAFAPFIEKARLASKNETSSKGRRRESSDKTKTLFSTLDAEEKDRFRVWAKTPTARRISDAKVQEWIDADRP